MSLFQTMRTIIGSISRIRKYSHRGRLNSHRKDWGKLEGRLLNSKFKILKLRCNSSFQNLMRMNRLMSLEDTFHNLEYVSETYKQQG